MAKGKILFIYTPRVSMFAFFCLLTFAICIGKTDAQPGDGASVPPPAKVIRKDVKEKLELETDVKRRTVLALALMETFLKQAEDNLSKEAFTEVYRELGSFHYLMDNTLAFLLFKDDGSGKTQNNLKRYEIGLRTFGPRLELIRRELPTDYEPYVGQLLKYLRESRSKAIDPMFGGT